MTILEEINHFLVGSEKDLWEGIYMCYCIPCLKPMTGRVVVLIEEFTIDGLLNKHLVKLPWKCLCLYPQTSVARALVREASFSDWWVVVKAKAHYSLKCGK